MAHSRTWNAAYEASPPNAQDAAQGATRIRELKLDIRERLDLDHIMDEDDTDDGRHRQVCLVEQASDPGNLTNKGFLYTKDVGGETELFYRDATGNVQQLTDAGKLLALDTQNDWTKGQAVTSSSITYAATVTPDASLSNAFRITLTGNVTINPPSNPSDGQVVTIQITQDGVGSRTLTFGSTIYGNSALDWTLSTAASSVDMLVLYYDGAATRWRALALHKDINNAL